VIVQSEVKREKLTEELDKKMAHLDDINQKENQSFERKIEEKMKKVLELAGKRTLEAKKEKNEALVKIVELETRLKALESERDQLKSSLESVTNKSTVTENKTQSLHETIVELAESNKNFRAMNLKSSTRITSLVEELTDLRQNLKEIRRIVRLALGNNAKIG
jgi:chromosome segregation ATPase